MGRNDQNESYQTYYLRPDTHVVSPLPATSRQRDQRGISFNGTVRGNGRNGQATAVPPFDWHASEALMNCYNG